MVTLVFITRLKQQILLFSHSFLELHVPLHAKSPVIPNLGCHINANYYAYIHVKTRTYKSSAIAKTSGSQVDGCNDSCYVIIYGGILFQG